MEYVEAYLKTIKSGQYNTPTMMFVFQDKDTKKGDPIVIPVDLTTFDDSSIRMASYTAVHANEGHLLDLILYAQFEGDHTKKESYAVTFGCRDALGNTLHRMYRFRGKGKKMSIIDSIPSSNVWTPPIIGTKKKWKSDRYYDPILTKAATDYAMLLAEK